MEILLGKGQHKFLTSQEKIVCGLAGRGAGKSWVGGLWCLKAMVDHPMSVGLMAGANPAMVSSVVAPSLVTLLKKAGISFSSGRCPDWDCPYQKSYVNTISIPNGSIVLLRSYHPSGADENIRGNTCDWLYFDEARSLDRGVFEDALATLRGPTGPHHTRLTTTPNGFDWIWKRFESTDKISSNRLIRWATHENQRNLPQDFIDNLKEQMTPIRFAQEVLAEFTEDSGAQVYTITNENIKPCIPWEGIRIILSLDLNVSPLHGTVLQIDKEKKLIQVLDEVYIESGGQTKLACEMFLQKWLPKVKELGLIYGCDESGSNTNTRSADTDVTIMRSILGQYGTSYNPFVKSLVVDRVNRVNGFLYNAKGERRLILDPKCKKTIEDFRQVKWLEGSEPRKLDKRDGLFSHGCLAAETKIKTPDGLKYLADIKAGQPIMTHLGIGQALWAGEIGIKKLVEMKLKDNSMILATEDHKWLSNCSWQTTSSLRNCQSELATLPYSMANNINGTDYIGAFDHGNEMEIDEGYIKQSGISMLRILEGDIITSITRIIIQTIIIQQTFNFGIDSIISHIIENCRIGDLTTWLDRGRLFGMVRMLVINCMCGLERYLGIKRKRRESNVSNVGNGIGIGLRGAANSVPTPVVRLIEERLALTKLNSFVNDVVISLCGANMLSNVLRGIAPQNVGSMPVSSIRKYSIQPVYSLESTHGSFILENGLISSNSDSVGYAVISRLGVRENVIAGINME